jgi:hypothetical protein
MKTIYHIKKYGTGAKFELSLKTIFVQVDALPG